MDQFSLEPLPLPPMLPLGWDDDPQQCSLLRHLRDQGRRDDHLAARLLALHDIRKLLRHWAPALQDRRDQVIAASGAMRRVLAELRTFSRQGQLTKARRAASKVEARHAGDGAEDRRRRLWPRWFPWLVIGLAGLFETWFFGQLLSFVANLDSSTVAGRTGALITLVPGLLLAVTLLLAGTLLGVPLARRGDARDGRPTDNPRPVWEVALPLAFCLLATVVALAWARAHFLRGAHDASVQEADLVPEWSIILLMVVATVAAILVKAVAHNPYADSAEQADRDLRAAGDQYMDLGEEADRALERLEVSWHRLQAAYLTARGDVQTIVIVRLWALQSEWQQRPADRDLDVTGNGVARDRSARAVAEDGLPLPKVDDMLEWLERTPSPRPALGPLWHAEQVLAEHSPRRLREELQRLVDALDGQLADTGDQ